MIPTSYDKALELNLDPAIYGTLAEIGAGQETANWFFRASGTAGLVAKTISAYDMTMSDAIYGKCARYVSAARLASMLDHEYGILLERLASKRGSDTTFFSFCNTVRARGYRDSGECHGWLGIRFQIKPGSRHSEVTIHIRLLDQRSIDQMEALGIVGLNLIYAAYRHRDDLGKFTESLTENLTPGRVEIDLLKFTGNGYESFDNRLCALQLVQSGLTDATMFLPDGEVVQPAEALHHKPVLLLRGSFNPVMNIHLEMLSRAREQFSCSLPSELRGSEVELCEITMHNLLRGADLNPVDFIDRANALQSLGKTVLVSRCPEFHRIAAFLNRCTDSPVGIILSIGLLNELFKSKWSEGLAGGLLESFGRLFKKGVTLEVFPWKNRQTNELVTAENFLPPENSKHLYRHFVENGRIKGIACDNESLLAYTGRDVCRMILSNDQHWHNLVPKSVWPIAERQAKMQNSDT
jgi:hypothetical protein